MRIFASVTFPGDLRKKVEAAQKRKQEAVWRALVEGGVLIHRTAVLSIAKISPGSTKGVRYSQAGKRREVNVSPPGEPPNSDTGRLLQSIRIVQLKGKQEVQVGTDLKYGAYLEFGAASIHLAARPWLQPAYNEHREEIIDAVKAAMGF